MCALLQVQILFCRLLKILIEEHHIQFKILYSVALVIPKFHFLVHYPEQIMRLIHWCIHGT